MTRRISSALMEPLPSCKAHDVVLTRFVFVLSASGRQHSTVDHARGRLCVSRAASYAAHDYAARHDAATGPGSTGQGPPVMSEQSPKQALCVCGE